MSLIEFSEYEKYDKNYIVGAVRDKFSPKVTVYMLAPIGTKTYNFKTSDEALAFYKKFV